MVSAVSGLTIPFQGSGGKEKAGVWTLGAEPKSDIRVPPQKSGLCQSCDPRGVLVTWCFRRKWPWFVAVV